MAMQKSSDGSDWLSPLTRRGIEEWKYQTEQQLEMTADWIEGYR